LAEAFLVRVLSALFLLLSAYPAAAGEIDRLIGEWQSPDGSSKQSFESAFDGEWIDTRLWFRTPDGWKLVSRGVIYRKPGSDAWHGIARATDMQGIVLFEFTLESAGAGGFRTHNTAYMETGEAMHTQEDWMFVDDDRWAYTVYRLENDERKPWIRGEWVRAE
jgi:hypothetical protein